MTRPEGEADLAVTKVETRLVWAALVLVVAVNYAVDFLFWTQF